MNVGYVLAGLRSLPKRDGGQTDLHSDPFTSTAIETGARQLPGNGRNKVESQQKAETSGTVTNKLLNLSRRLKTTRAARSRDLEQAQASTRPWNGHVLRAGDQLDIGGSGSLDGHPNKFLTSGVLHLAWCSIGKNLVARSGVSGCQGRGLAITSTVGSIVAETQHVFGDVEIDRLCISNAVPTILKFYDATPSRVRFGKLQDIIMPWARFPVWDSDAKRWRLVPYTDYASTASGRLPGFGILDILGTGATITYMDQDTGEIEGVKFMTRPMVLQRGNSSCIFAGVEAAIPEVSIASIVRICQNVDFAFWLEMPDAHTANTKTQEHTKTKLPENCGMVAGKCGGHQGHRIVQSREKTVIGDVHAIAVTCLNTGFQNRFQKSLHLLLKSPERFQYIDGYPDPEWRAHNEQVLLHTILRRDAMVNGGVLDFSEASLDAFPVAQRFLDTLNGDWTKPVVQCFTCGRAITEDVARELVFASIIEIDMLQANGKEPSMDDWFSCGMSCGKTAVGVFCHELLPQVVEESHIVWDDKALVNNVADPEAVDGAEAARVRGKKKAWRTKCVLADASRKLGIALMSFLAIGVEHIMMRLDYLDERHDGILSVGVPGLCPFQVCSTYIADTIAGGFKQGAVLSPIYRHFRPRGLDTGSVTDNALLDTARIMGMDIGAQVFWRYMPLKEPPYSLTKCINRRSVVVII